MDSLDIALPYFFAPFGDEPSSHDDGRADRRAVSYTRSEAPRTELDVTDRAYVDGVRRGDETVYGELFTALYSPLREFAAAYLGRVAEGEEIVQDVFLDLWMRREEWNPQGSVRAYLFRAVRNRAVNALKHAKTAGRLTAGDVAEWMGRAESPDSTAPETELVRALADAIATLPPARRSAAMLRWRQGLSYAEIAEMLGTSVASVTMHIARAREAVRPVVERFLKE